MNLEYKVIDNTYKTLKDLLKNYFYVSDRLICKLKREKRLIVNNENVYINQILNFGDQININIDFEEESDNIVSTKMDLNILYEDSSILVIDKPQGISIHPSQGHYDNSLSNGVKYYFDKIGLKRKIRLVNRLDKDTSGIVIFAKNDYIHECFIKQMKSKTYVKKYLGIVEGILSSKEGAINAPIARKEGSIIEREINSEGEYALTNYKVIEEYDNKYSLLEFILETGRTHQIRVHCKYINHPLLGDTLYGNKNNNFKGQALIAYKIEFIHPLTKNKMQIISKIHFQKENILL
ncbi:MAG: RluA family pseudouridine synthase [Clostridia bacterium]|nr:RluA family pseudouridine synthase [Clostridia bacterium]